MLYLAQVKKNPLSNALELHLLAHQESAYIWEMNHQESISLDSPYHNQVSDNLLVLVDLDEKKQIINLINAKDWVMSLIGNYLNSSGASPELIAKEQDRIEQWRREMTSQNQELRIRQLELETRTEQLQELEENLKREQEKLEARFKEMNNEE